MNTTDPTTLIEGLRNWAEGMAPDRAAVELLIEHDSWLRRGDFLKRCVETFPTEDLPDPDHPVSRIDWEEVDRALEEYAFPASSSAVGILRIAASIGSSRATVNLRDALVGLDSTNSAAVVRAVTTTTQH